MLQKFKNLKQKLGKWFWVILIVLVVVVGYFVFGRKSGNGTSTETVKKGEVREELILTGSVAADKYARLYFPTGGKISAVYAKEGQWVKKGTALSALDTLVLSSVYQQSLNTYRNYQAAADSALDSVKNHSSDETFAQKATRTAAETARDSAYDSMKAAEYNLKNSIIHAPFTGLITSLPFTSPGVNVMVTDMQVEILDPASVYFDVEADQNEVININQNQKVDIVLDSYKDKILPGVVTYVGFTPKPGEASTVYKVRVQIDSPTLKDISPRIGMSGDAKFLVSKKDEVLYVSPKFINSDKDGKFVYVGNKKNKIRISVGIEGEDRVEITSGVKEGDTLYD